MEGLREGWITELFVAMHTIIISLADHSDVLARIGSQETGLRIYPGTAQETREIFLGKVS